MQFNEDETKTLTLIDGGTLPSKILSLKGHLVILSNLIKRYVIETGKSEALIGDLRQKLNIAGSNDRYHSERIEEKDKLIEVLTALSEAEKGKYLCIGYINRVNEKKGEKRGPITDVKDGEFY